VQVAYDTKFFIQWPEHLGGGSITIDLEGTMIMSPLLMA